MNQATTEPKEDTRGKPKPPRFVIGVRLRGQEKSDLFDPQDLNLRVGTWVIIRSKQGERLGVVASNKILNFYKNGPKPQGVVVRPARTEDFAAAKKKEAFENQAKLFCLQQIDHLNLPMNLSRVIFLGNLNKVIFFFTADGRVDFRELVRILAHNLKTRIELRQVGVRDEAKAITGYGICGESLCCSTFLDGFTPVTIRMAKDQGLALNPSKISGVCGRLMCCLQYEHDIYKKMIKGVPKHGSRVETPDGPGRVVKVGILESTVSVLLDDESLINYPLREVTVTGKPDARRPSGPERKRNAPST